MTGLKTFLFLLILAVVNTSPANGTEIIGDGNCFYRCLAKYLFDNQDRHEEIRSQIIKYMSGTDCPQEEGERRITRYQSMVTGSYERYLRGHSRLGEFSDDAIVQAAADLYGFDLYISSYGISSIRQRSVAFSMGQQSNTRWLHLRLQGSHFTIDSNWMETETDCRPEGKFIDLFDLVNHGAEPYDSDKGLDVLDSSKREEDTNFDLAKGTKGKRDKFREILRQKEEEVIRNRHVENIGARYDTDLLSKELLEIEVSGEERDEQQKRSEEQDDIEDVVDVIEVVNQNKSEGSSPVKEKNLQKGEFELCTSFDHLLDLHHQGQVNSGTVCRVKRTHYITYYHYFTISEISTSSVTIVHLCSSMWTISCKQKTVTFCTLKDSEFDFASGVSVLLNTFPRNESTIKKFENRVKYFLSIPYISYSLVDDQKWHCQSIACYISTGEKESFEPSDFIGRYRIIGTCIVSVVSFFALLHEYFTNFKKSLELKNTIRSIFRRIQSSVIDVYNKAGSFLIWLFRYPVYFLFFPFFRKF